MNVLTEFTQYALLDRPSSQSDGVGNAVKGNHGIFRNEAVRIPRLERQLYFLSNRNCESATRSRISVKFSIAMSAMASVFTLRSFSNSVNTLVQSAPC